MNEHVSMSDLGASRLSTDKPLSLAILAMGGQGAGGKPDFAQGGAPDDSKAEAGIDAVKALIAQG